MPENPNHSTGDLDDGTWHQPAQDASGHPTEIPTPKNALSSGLPVKPRDAAKKTAPGGASTSPPFSTPPGEDSAESDESTPTPRADALRSDEWDRLPAPKKIEAGQVLFGKYLLEKKIGEGGMGEVWLVENMNIQRESALKLIKPEFAQNDKGWKRFAREAHLMAKITHPNAVAIYDANRTHSMAYIEMEYVRGSNLEKALKGPDGRSIAMPLDSAAQILDQLCSVLQEAHGYFDEKRGKPRPIIHRDLKPSNLMLIDRKPAGQNLNVLDFGIAKMMKVDGGSKTIQDDGGSDATKVGDLVGTPSYMSPEQIQGGITKDGRGEIDGRSDLYSVGVLLYQLLTGVLPFQGMSRMAVLAAHLNSPPPPMKEANPAAKVPAAVERVVMKCLEKDPDRRPQSALELVEQFRAAVEKSRPRPRKFPAAWPLAICGVIAAAALIVGGREALRRYWTKPDFIPPPPVVVPDISAWWTEHGFEVLDVDRLNSEAREKGLERGLDFLDNNTEPAGLRRKSDQAVFYAFDTGIYLPLGYHPEDRLNKDGFWPKVLVRSDDVRFVRISGGNFDQGDFRRGKPLDDHEGNECTLHKVEVAGFYMQETEVTNREIESFQNMFPDARLGEWKEVCDFQLKQRKRPLEEVARYPAVSLDRSTAQQYARSVSGRLPTESEWEYAARSCGQRNLWAQKNGNAKKGRPRAHLGNLGGNPFPIPVKEFKDLDETDQQLFDMTGNVREWCLDVYKPYSKIIAAGERDTRSPTDPGTFPEPSGPKDLTKYVVRGGSFSKDDPEEAMTFYRDAVAAAEKISDLGFRVVLECPPEPKLNAKDK